MTWYLVLQVALTLGLLSLIGFIIYVLIQFHKTLRTLDQILTGVNQELPSLLIKLQVALDGVNSELGRVEDIVSSFQEVSATVQNTTGIVRRVVVSPVVRVTSVLSGARAALATLVGRKSGEDV